MFVRLFEPLLSDDEDDVVELFVELLVPLLLLLLLLFALLLFRVARFVARAEIRLFKSSRNRDFNGDTCFIFFFFEKIVKKRFLNVR